MDYFDSPECNPRGWSLVRIEELISDLRGGAPLEPEDFVEKGFPVLHKGAIKQAGQIEIDPNKKTFADEGFSRKHKSSIITRNHVAVTLRDLESIRKLCMRAHVPEDQCASEENESKPVVGFLRPANT